MRDLYVAAVYLALLGLGCAAPFVFALAYIWVDVAYPQYVAPGLLGGVPVSLIAALGAIAGYLFADRRAPPRFGATAWLTLAMAAWVTLTTTWAVAPEFAWVKWDWAVKTVLFSLCIPYLFRSRVQIEAMLLVFVFSALTHMLPVGVKSLISGGRYGMDLGILGNNLGLSESSGLATVSVLFIPIHLYMRRHSLILPPGRWRSVFCAGLVVLSIATAIGTVARTAIVGFGVAGGVMWLRSRRKLAFGLVLGVAATLGAYSTSSAWNERIATIESPTSESSALVRLLVWRWTLDFAAEHPLGGGFEAYRVDRVEIPAGVEGGAPVVEFGRAFHSLYFELLGEHGYVGLGLFLLIAARCLLVYQGVIRRTRDAPGLAWCRDLAIALQCALLTMLACGAFIGIAFQPTFWYLCALSTCLAEYVRRALATGARAPGVAVAASRAWA